MKSIPKTISDGRKLSQEKKNGFNKILILHVSNTENIRNEIYPVVIRFQGLLTVWPMIFYHNIIFQPAYKSTRSDNLFCWNKLQKYANQDDKIVYLTWFFFSYYQGDRNDIQCIFVHFWDLIWYFWRRYHEKRYHEKFSMKICAAEKRGFFLESIAQEHK